MNLEHAIERIEQALARMEQSFRMPVFDEWAILSLQGEKAQLLYYHGQRSQTLQTQLARDMRTLVDALWEEDYEPGHFFFSREGDRELYDAFLCVGPDAYAVLNNTGRSMSDITADPLWTRVQRHFVDMAESFRAQPFS